MVGSHVETKTSFVLSLVGTRASRPLSFVSHPGSVSEHGHLGASLRCA